MISASTMPTPPTPEIGALADAIAQAENAPASWNNPGALALGDRGYGVGNSAGVSIFGSAADGWNALYNQLDLVLHGQSAYENTGMTIQQFAVAWTGNDNPSSWAATVAGALGVSTGTTIGQVLEGAPAAQPIFTIPFSYDATEDPGSPLYSGMIPSASPSGFSLSSLALLVGLGIVALLLLPGDA